MKRNNYCIKGNESLQDLIYLNAIRTIEKTMQDAKPGLKRHEEAYKEIKRLEKIGLGESLNAESLKEDASRYESHLKAKERIGFMREAWCWLGEDTFMLFPKLFKELLQKKNLRCERLSRYKGRLSTQMLKGYSKAERNCRNDFGSGSIYMERYATNHCEGLTLPSLESEEDSEEVGWISPNEGFFIAVQKPVAKGDKEENDALIFSYSDRNVIMIHSYQSGGGKMNQNLAKRYKQLQNQIM